MFIFLNNKIVCLTFSYGPKRLIYANVFVVVIVAGTFGCGFIYAWPEYSVVYSRRPRAIAGHINWPSQEDSEEDIKGEWQAIAR